MTNHFGKDHKGLKASEHRAKYKVQLIFKGGLQKYTQVEEYNEMEVDSEGDSEWKRAVEKAFAESMANIKSCSVNGHRSLQLMNVFIAKTRWDVMVEGKDLKEIVTIACAPAKNQNLHKIILC